MKKPVRLIIVLAMALSLAACGSKEDVIFDGPKESFTETSYVVPAGVTRVGVEAFANCDSLTSIKVPVGLDVSNWGLPDSVEIIYY